MAKLVLTRNKTPVKSFPLDQERLSIGRAKDNDIRLDDRAVSGHHAVIVTLGEDSFLQDLNSTNGTYVNGKPVKKHTLRQGDMIQLGTNELEYDSERASGADSDQFERTMVIRPQAKPSEGMPSEKQVRQAVHEATGGWLSSDQEPDNAQHLPLARLQVLSGRNFGEEIVLSKSMTTVGRPGVQVAAITRRSEGYTIVHVREAGEQTDPPPRINGKPIGGQAIKLHDNDVIELAGIKMGFFLDST